MKAIEEYVKALWLDSRVMLRYGTRSPSCVGLARSDHSIYVDPSDVRARRKLIRASVRGRIPRNQQFWRRGCEMLRPAVALDVGLNYGECLFAGDYDPHARLIGIEANPGLRPFVDRSRSIHPNRQQIELHFALASDVHRQQSDFFVMQRWSGGSTALAEITEIVEADYDKVEVESLRIDELLLPTLEPSQLLLFKIDVEGFEPAVMRGMEESLERVETAVGLIEYDTKLLDRSGDGAAVFWSQLQLQFEVYAFVSQRAMVNVSRWSLAEVKNLLGREAFHTDLLLAKNSAQKPLDEFLSRWLKTHRQPRRDAA